MIIVFLQKKKFISIFFRFRKKASIYHFLLEERYARYLSVNVRLSQAVLNIMASIFKNSRGGTTN